MGPLVAVGSVSVPAVTLRNLERSLDDLCRLFGFPPGEEFKWSPRRDQWMYAQLVEEARENFFGEALRTAAAHEAKALVVIEDTTHRRASQDDITPEPDVVRMFLERVEQRLAGARSQGVVIADRPSGDRAAEDRFLASCLETLQAGTKYVKPDHIVLSVLSTPSRLVRLIQLADLVASCSLARVAGEGRFSPPVFDQIRPLLYRDLGRVGGIGLKIHPDFVYANLYHWLLGDRDLIRWPTGVPLPIEVRPYGREPDRR